MAHFQQLRFVEMAARHMTDDWTGLSVVEIGSADVNGSIRPYFAGSVYSGVDLAPGPGVEIVASGDDVALPDGSVDLAISCECFEHNPKWLETFVNMHRMTKPGGVVAFTCASRGRLEHGTTRTRPFESPGTIAMGWDYYRNLTRGDFERRLPLGAMFERHAFFGNDVSKDLYFLGRKPGGASRALRLDLPELWGHLNAVNTLIAPDEPRTLRARISGLLDGPPRWTANLPDSAYQNLVIRWTAAGRVIRRLLRGR